MNERKASKIKLIRSCAVLVGVIVVIVIALLFLKKWEKQQGNSIWQGFEGETAQTIRYDGKWYTLRSDVESILVIGLDKFDSSQSLDSYNNDKQADFLSLIVLDKASDKVTTLHINRDTMAQMNILGLDGSVIGTKKAQLALSHTYGSGGKDSCKNTLEAVSYFLYETPVDHYVSLTMDAVQKLNDMVGGVTVTLLDDFSHIDAGLVKGKEVTLKGSQALTYVRARSGVADETNENRMKRQRQYLDALYKKVSDEVIKDEEFISKAGLKIAENMVSDCTVHQLERIAQFISENNAGEILEIKGESKKGEQFMEFYPDEDALQKQIIELFYEPK